MDDHFEQIAGEALDSPGEDALTINNSDTDQGVAPSISVPQLNTAPGASEEVNPERDRLERDLATALVRRDGLMRQFTSDHPQVQDLTLQVEDLQQRLAQLSLGSPGNSEFDRSVVVFVSSRQGSGLTRVPKRKCWCAGRNRCGG